MTLIKIFSDFRQKRFEKECRNRFLHLQKTFRRNRFFIFFGFVTFSDFGHKFSKKLHKIFRKIVKTAFYVFRQRVWWKKGNLSKIVFFSKIEQFFSWLLAKNIPQRWQNCFVSVKTNTLMYNNFFENVFFFLFRFLAENFPNFLIFFAKFWKQLPKNWDEQFDQKMFFEKFSSFFGIGSKHFLIFGQKSYGKIVRNVFYVFKDMLKEQIFSISIPSCRVVGFWAKLFWHLAEYFPQSCQNCFLRNQTNTLMKRDDFGNMFFFRSSSKFIPDFWKIYSSKLAELLSKRSDEHFDVQPTTSLKNSSSSFGFWSKLSLSFWILFFSKLWKLFPKKGNEHFDQKPFFWTILPKVFRNRIETFSGFLQKSWESLSELLSTWCSKTCWRNRIFNFFSFCCVVGLWAKFFWHLA